MTDTPPPVPFDTLLRHRDFLRTLARRLVADPNAADDVEQETWLEAMRRPPRDATSVRGWLASVARNAARKLGRSAARRAKYEGAASPRGPQASTDELVAEAEIGRGLIEFVLALDEPYRGTVLLRYFEGLETVEISARTGVPLETVRTRLKRATAQLREAMDRRHRGNRAAWAFVLVGPDWTSTGLAELGKGIAMGAAKKLTIAAVALFAVGGAAWFVATETTGGRAPRSSQTAAISAEPANGTHRRVEPGAESVKSSDAAPLFDPKASRRVAVRALDGTPVGGATIEFFIQRERLHGWTPELGARFGETPSPDASYLTGADGIAILPKRTPDEAVVLVRHAGFAAARFWSVLPAEVLLFPACELTGRVLDARGNPVAGATVLGGSSEVRTALGPDPEVVRSVSDANGRFALRDLPAGTVQVFAGWPRGVPTRVAQLVVPSTKTIDVTLPGGVPIEGKVTESGTGAPVEGAVVSIRLDGDSHGTEAAQGAATTDAAGAYRIEGYAAQQWTDATAAKPGWYEAPRGRGSYRNRLPPGGGTRMDFVMARGGRVAGRVLCDGEPVAGAKITASGTKDGHDEAKRRATSDAEGRYSVDGLPPGRATLVVAAEGAYQEGFSGDWTDQLRERKAPAASLVEILAGEEVKKDIALARGVEVSGRVLDLGGAPAASAPVRLWYGDSRDPDGPLSERRTETIADGIFSFRGVVPGQSVHLYAADSQAGGHLSPAVDPKTGARDLVLRLKRSEPACVVHVRVIWPEGAAPAGATYVVGWLSGWVVNSGDRDNAFSGARATPVPADGRFDVTNADSGESPLVVRVVAPGFALADSAPLKIDAATKETTIEIRPDRGARFAGRVVVKGGDDGVTNACVRLRFVDPLGPPAKDVWYSNAPRPVVGPIAATTDAKGVFELTSLVPGSYDVQIMAPGMESWTGKVEVPSESRRFELPRLGVVTGRIQFADGSPAGGVWVMLEGRNSKSDTTADADGRFRLDDAPTGGLTVRVCYSFDGTGANVRQFTVKGSKHAGEDLDIVVEPGLAISGRLAFADGTPFRGSAIVRAYPAGQAYAAESIGTGADGTFNLRGLAPGRHRVSAEILKQSGDLPYRCAAAESVESGTSGLALVVQSGLAIEGVFEFPAAARNSVHRVYARRPGVRGMDANREPGAGPATIDADGHFRVDGLDPGERVLVVQDDSGLDSPWQAGAAALVEAGASDVRLALSTSSTISGVVVFDGASMQSCNVVARAIGDEKDACAVISWSAGRFTFVGLDPSKRWDLEAHREGLAPARVANLSIGSTDVRLELSRGLTIAGRVLRADGSVAAKIHVVFQRVEGKDEGWGSCDEKGNFEAKALTAGEFVVKAYLPAAKEGEGGEYVEVGRVRAGDVGVELRLPR